MRQAIAYQPTNGLVSEKYTSWNSVTSCEISHLLLALYVISMVLAVPMLLLTFCIPRSKRWLLLHGYRDEALESMRFIYRGDHVEKEFQMLESRLTFAREASFGGGQAPSLWNSDYRSALIASMGLIVFQQCSGQPSVLSYTTVLFQAAGWSGNASVVTSILMMGTSMITVAMVDRVGRKRLLFSCCAIMMTALFTLSICFWKESLTKTSRITMLIAMFVYIAGYQVGFGPITWCIISEIFPMEIRGKAIALGVELNYTLNFLVQLMFPLLKDSLGFGRSFALFGFLLGICIVFIHTKVPETKGLTLEEIQVLLSTKQRPRTGSQSTDTENDEYLHEESPLLCRDP